MPKRQDGAFAESIFGWNRDDTFEVVRSRSNVIRGKWVVSLRNRDHVWWHSETVYTEEQAKALFDHFVSLPERLLEPLLHEMLRIDAGIILA